MFKLKLSHLGATIALLSAAFTVATPKAAQAFSFSVEAPGITTTSRANATVIDFSTVLNGAVQTSPTPLPITPTNNGGVTIANTDTPAIYTTASPVFAGGGRYLSVGAGLELSQEGVVQLDFDATRGLGYFGLFWGSPGNNDSITFVLRDAGGVTNRVTYTAADIFGVAFSGLNSVVDTTGLPPTIRPGRYVNFFSTNNGPNANKVIESVLLEDSGLRSIGRSFQVDNIAYEAIPTPALLPGILGFGFSFWKKRRNQLTAS